MIKQFFAGPLVVVLPGLILGLFLTGCGLSTPIVPEQPDGRGLRAQKGPDDQRARQLMAAGNWLAAAQEYQRLARRASAPARQDYLLLTARALIRAGHSKDASGILGQLQPTIGDARLIIRRQILLAEVALVEGNGPRALQLLNMNLPANLPGDLHADIHRMRAETFSATGNHIDFVSERVKLETYLNDQDALANNRELIWQGLMGLSAEALKKLQLNPPPNILSGWMELAFIAKRYANDPVQLASATDLWQRLYPGHPAPVTYASGKFSLAGLHAPKQIALLLPLSNQFAPAARAIRDGFLAAYYQDTAISGKPVIKVYTVTAENVLNMYQQAIAEGADFVVGPLQKHSVNLLAASGNLEVPVLALNNITTSSIIPDTFYQFGLSPENEARQVAERIWLDGLEQGVALVPEGNWGDRVQGAFSERFTQLGGRVVEVKTYNASDKEFSRPISSMLKVDASKTRHRTLKTLLNSNIKFKERRRQDIDFIFMAAFPRQARQLRPGLKFFNAAHLPVYSTSHVYRGINNKRADRDMNGLIFGDMPWVLRKQAENNDAGLLYSQVNQNWPQKEAVNSRLYALGVDAYRVIPYLKRLGTHPLERFYGVTGSLRLDTSRRIQRQLIWARFSKGLPREMETVSRVHTPQEPTQQDSTDESRQPIPPGQFPTGPIPTNQ
ncbi:MAG: penicillin-binding protein activator [Gammaproteobacteria bacterium]|nr:MAG: penicillin-binding protein activator [Gammaproteobacteria bacterium]